MELEEYFEALEKHDWFYMYSDDNRAYKAGTEQRERLVSISNQSNKHQDMYLFWCSYVNDSGAEKPKLSDFLESDDANK